MELSLCPQVLYNRTIDDALKVVSDEGIKAIELPVNAQSPFVDLDAALKDGGEGLLKRLAYHGVAISAVSNHQEGTLLMGPHDSDTDGIIRGSPEEKIAYATRRLRASGDLAKCLGVETVIAFIGCHRWSRFFPWPASNAWEPMVKKAVERLLPILDYYESLGVRLALECHPGQLVYDLETAQQLLEYTHFHPALGFNLDPANLLLVGADPIVFAAEMGDRIWHVHAKDGERVHHNVRSSLLAQGAWDRRTRGFRFRVPGWGDVNWRKLITELHVGGYNGYLAIEHEDPTMGRLEGIRQAKAYLSPLLLRDPLEKRWW